MSNSSSSWYTGNNPLEKIMRQLGNLAQMGGLDIEQIGLKFKTSP